MEAREISIPVGRGIQVKGNLVIPPDAGALVLFSHGSGSSRFSPRNRFVAGVLNRAGMATLLSDLLTENEDAIYANRFDIDVLTERLVAVTRYARQLPELAGLLTGYFGASTGAASALKAAALLGESISAVVSRGGRPDLAGEALQRVTAPTLLIVGSLDEPVIGLNEQAYARLRYEKKLQIIPGASHLFEEAGKLEQVAELAREWFMQHFHQARQELASEKRIKP